MVSGETRQVLEAGRGRWTDQVAGAMMALPSLTSRALTQANRDCEIRTVTGRARRDEKDKASSALTKRISNPKKLGL